MSENFFRLCACVYILPPGRPILSASCMPSGKCFPSSSHHQHIIKKIANFFLSHSKKLVWSCCCEHISCSSEKIFCVWPLFLFNFLASDIASDKLAQQQTHRLPSALAFSLLFNPLLNCSRIQTGRLIAFSVVFNFNVVVAVKSRISARRKKRH